MTLVEFPALSAPLVGGSWGAPFGGAQHLVSERDSAGASATPPPPPKASRRSGVMGPRAHLAPPPPPRTPSEMKDQGAAVGDPVPTCAWLPAARELVSGNRARSSSRARAVAEPGGKWPQHGAAGTPLRDEGATSSRGAPSDGSCHHVR